MALLQVARAPCCMGSRSLTKLLMIRLSAKSKLCVARPQLNRYCSQVTGLQPLLATIVGINAPNLGCD